RRVAGRDAGGELRLEDLARLAPALWRACIGWLLEQQGYSLNVLTSGATEACWRGADFDGQLIFIRALNGLPSEMVSDRDVAETARKAREHGLERALLLAPGSSFPAAQELAAASRVNVIDGEALRAWLAMLADSADHRQESAQAEMKTRAR